MFGEYVVRYVPLMLQNIITENFNKSLNHKDLLRFREKESEMYQTIKEKIKSKVYWFAHIHDQAHDSLEKAEMLE